MMELVVTACLISKPLICKDFVLNYLNRHVTPQQCMLYGQVEMAKWQQHHPKYKITRWKCAIVKNETEA